LDKAFCIVLPLEVRLKIKIALCNRRFLFIALISSFALNTPAIAQWGWGYYGPGGYYGGYGGYGSGYGAGGEGCGGINCEGDGWDGGYANMKDAERESSDQDVQFDKEFSKNVGKKLRLCKSKTPQYNDWGDFIGYKPVKIPC
jgi:hypothetical protein